MLARVDSRELTEWQAYERRYGPLGQPRDDVLTAVVCALIANVNRDPKKRRKPYTVDDFLPQWSPKDPQTPEDMAAMLRAVNAMFGGTEQ